ncbi:MAG: DUF255 domain-containing protein [Planctomycetota bacterium]|nr:MAG: DUF255 domain-containing protein [Planctomycetota bacterium]
MALAVAERNTACSRKSACEGSGILVGSHDRVCGIDVSEGTEMHSRKVPCHIMRLAAFSLLLLCGFAPQSSFADDTPDPDAAEPAETQNRLADETSPYLRLHAHNPVDWYPWGEEAFEKAQRENKPIFLSIGYSSCFWCHVMERKVFENAEIAAYMNEYFVNVKVDREERPEIDDLYMLALQVYHSAIGSNQGGGWPLSMFLTPDGKPFAGGTYFPPEDLPGRPGFMTVLKQIQDLWATRADNLKQNAEVITREVRRLAQPSLVLDAAELDRSVVDAGLAAVMEHYDPQHGGFDFDADAPIGPKFPVPSRLMLIQTHDDGDHTAALEALDHTLQRMAAGGLRDHLGGGFHRYSVNREWRVPHFEKMLYDNAQLAEVYAAAYARTGREEYRVVAEETLDFLLAEMADPRGGFYSALDAETDGVEGKYYVWSQEQITQALGEEDADLFRFVYGMDGEQIFEHGYVLYLPQPLDAAAAELGISQDELSDRIQMMRHKLLHVRRERPALLRDDKILTGWNGLTIRALARAGRALDREDYITAAERSAQFLLDEMRSQEGRLLHTLRPGQAPLYAYLDDYAFLVAGLLALHDVTGEDAWLDSARRLTEEQIELFRDDRGGFYFTPTDHEQLLARARDAYDSVIPSGNSVSVDNLVKLAVLTGEDAYQEYAAKTLNTFAGRLTESPASMAYLTLALDRYLTAFGPPGVTAAVAVAETGAAPAQGDEEDKNLTPAAKLTDEEAKKHEKVSAKAYLSVDRLPAGGECEVAVVIDIIDGWHINANPAQPKFLIATEIKAAGKLKTALEDPVYPEGHAFEVKGFDEPLSVYEERVVLRGTLRVPASAAGKTETLELTVRYQTCNDKTCLRPMNLKMTAEVPVAERGQRVRRVNESLFKPADQE